jgi:O-antigen/teichoic acid export membrane protein
MATSNFALGYLPANIVRPLLFLLLVAAVWSQGTSLTADLSMKLQVVTLIALALGTTALRIRSTREIRSSTLPPLGDEKKIWNRAALPLLGLVLFTNYFQQITVIVSGFFLSSADIGIYNVGYRIAMLISFTLIAIDAFVAPSLSRFYHADDRARLVKEIQYSTALRFGVSLLAVMFLVVFGDWVLAFFGAEFTSGYILMIFLALAQLAHAAVGPVTRILAISGHQNFSMYASGVSLVIWLALTAVLLPIYGVNGVAVSVFVSLTGWALVLRHLVKTQLGISIFVIVRDIQPAAVPPIAEELAD